MRTTRPALMLSSALAVLVATPAVAQTIAAADADQSPTTQRPTGSQPESGQVEDVVVTAQKREQSLIDVPQSVTVVSGADLENQQANSIADYLKLVPGLQLNQSTLGSGRIVLRGINTGGVASTVATYVDETPFGSSTGLANGAILAGDFDTFDVARIEVLRGPQGTLYGANTLGGLIKYVTNAPNTERVEGRVRGTVETTRGGAASYRGNVMLNLPLGETLAFRATGFYNKNGGWIDSIGTATRNLAGATITADRAENINDSESYGGRASLLFKPSDAFDLRLTAFLQNIRPDASSTVEVDPVTLKPKYGRQTQSVFVPEFRNVDYRVYNGLLNYDFGFATLTSSSSYATQKQTLRTDLTFFYSGLLQAALGFPANELRQDQRTNTTRFTQEVRLAGARNATFEWLLGGYYNDERGLVDQNLQTFVPGTTTAVAPPTPPFPVGTAVGLVRLSSKYREYAGFGNATLHLGDMFDIDLGGRYSHNTQRAAQSGSGVLAAGAPANSNLRSSDDVFTYSAAPKLKLSDHASIYLRVAKGYRPGGPNVIAANAPAGTPASFDPDTTVNYEAGVKAETDDRTFSFDLSGFHINWNRIQLLTVVNNFGININGTSARSDGLEFLTTFRPGAGFVASINGAYTKARLTGDAPTQVGGRRGDRLPYTPEYSISTNADYGWALGGDVRASIGGSLRFLAKQNAAFDLGYRTANGRQRELPSYAVVDLRAGVDFGRFSIEAFGRNITDSYGLTAFSPPVTSGLPAFPNGAAGASPIRPRTIGVAVTAGF